MPFQTEAKVYDFVFLQARESERECGGVFDLPMDQASVTEPALISKLS